MSSFNVRLAGVGEPLNEPGFDGKGLQIRGTFRVFVMDTPEEAAALRKLTLAMALKPILAFSSKPLSPRQSLIDPTALPDNVQLLSLEQTSAKVRCAELSAQFLLVEQRRDAPEIRGRPPLARGFRARIRLINKCTQAYKDIEKKIHVDRM